MRALIAAFAILPLLIAIETWAGPVTDQLKGTLDLLIDALNDPALKDQGKAE